MMSYTPEQRRMRARMGGLTTAARGHVNTEPARAALMARFETDVDPDRTLPLEERARRAEAAKKLHFTKLALKSSVVRAMKAGRRREAKASEPAFTSRAIFGSPAALASRVEAEGQIQSYIDATEFYFGKPVFTINGRSLPIGDEPPPPWAIEWLARS